MDYIELKCPVGYDQSELSGELIAILGENGFESFSEESNELLAYIPSSIFDESLLNIIKWPDSYPGGHTWQLIPEQNWNAVWEQNFQPVTIDNRCHIRAPFHPEDRNAIWQIVIEPKMSFGTAHHETTALMIEYLLDLDVQEKTVLDMGCGTGILAILASLKGSGETTAIDNNEWAYRNSLENIERNNTMGINVYLGDASLLNSQSYEVILANINRNILLEDIPVYVKSLSRNGVLLMSGFYDEDLPIIRKCAESQGCEYVSHKEKNKWVAAYFQLRDSTEA